MSTTTRSTGERLVQANGVQLCTEDLGDPNDPAILLIQGACASMIWWDHDFCAELVKTGRYVIRFDCRDQGRSTAYAPGAPPYDLNDLADDAVALLDSYGVPEAHVIGGSSGGIVGQLMALRHPARTASLILMCSTPTVPGAAHASAGTDGAGSDLPGPGAAVMDLIQYLADVDWSDLAACVEASVVETRALAGTDRYPLDEAAHRRYAIREYARQRSVRSSASIHRSPRPGRRLGVHGSETSRRQLWCCTARRTRSSPTHTAWRSPRRSQVPSWSPSTGSGTACRAGAGQPSSPPSRNTPTMRATTNAMLDNRVAQVVQRHPVVTYFVLAYALTWWVYLLLSLNPLIGILGLFGPALAAILVAALTEGRAGMRVLLGRTVRWRVPVPWYLVAIGLPALLALLAAGLSIWFGPAVLRLGPLTVLDFVLVVLVLGEELGWRGYALPALLQRRSPLVASLILGVLWGMWHLPTFFIPGTPQFGLPVVAFLILTTAYSILLSWIFLHTRGSVLIATLVHGAINLSQGFLLAGTDPANRYWWLALAYTGAALVLAAVLGPQLSRRVVSPSARTQ